MVEIEQYQVVTGKIDHVAIVSSCLYLQIHTCFDDGIDSAVAWACSCENWHCFAASISMTPLKRVCRSCPC